jgi:hypothetical protein
MTCLNFIIFLRYFYQLHFFIFIKIFKNKYLYILISTVILVLTVPTSFTNLTNSYLNKSMAYSLSEMDAGY